MLQIQGTACDCMRVHKIARKCKRVHDGARDGTTFTCRAGGRIGLVGPPNSPHGLPAYSHGGAMLNGVKFVRSCGKLTVSIEGLGTQPEQRLNFSQALNLPVRLSIYQGSA